MGLASPLPNDTRSRFADWVEIVALTAPRGVATRADVLAICDILEEDGHEIEVESETGDPMETEILDDERATVAEAIVEELGYRSRVLGAAYPFHLDVRGTAWRLATIVANGQETEARTFYVFCLLVSAIRDGRIEGEPAKLAELTTALPNHFQAIATEAAAHVVGGDSMSFGWPRPDGAAFKPALRQLAQRLRVGKPLETEPLWSNGAEKDAGIDVIAWRDFDDLQPGKIILLGQVASGNNWNAKPIATEIHRFLNWFSEKPTHHYVSAMFIPFPQHHECEVRQDQPFEAVAHAEAWLREQKFGLVIDRLRIVLAAGRHVASKGAAERQARLEPIAAWSDAAVSAVGRAA